MIDLWILGRPKTLRIAVATLAVGFCLTTFDHTAAWADAGNGGATFPDSNGGAGGTGAGANIGSVGSSGVNGGGGGGGGGAGGGAGGAGFGGGGTGGLGGTSISPDGGNGNAGNAGGNNGGGGGGGGFHGLDLSSPLNNSTTVNGGNGGTGGNGAQSTGVSGGGGGGAGGFGAITSSSSTSTNSGSITGGNGGAGGTGNLGFFIFGASGNGGDGGAGVSFTSIGATFMNVAPSPGAAIVSGGDGGAGGADFGIGPGSPGVGGVGVLGSDLTVITNGSISGGLAGDGVTRSNAIGFTGGTNILELRSGYSFTGDVVANSAADTLRLGGTTDATFDLNDVGAGQQFRNFGILAKSGSSTWTLTGASTFSGGITVSDGILQGSTDSLQSAITNNARVRFDQTALGTYAGNMSGTGGLTKTGTATLILSGANTYAGGTIIDQGTLQLSGGSALSDAGAVTLTNTAGARLNLNGTSETIGSLAGGGTSGGEVAFGGATLTTGGDNTNTTFAGSLTGAGGILRKVGTGTQILTGVNNYTGGTTVSAGTLRGSTDSLQGNIQNDATLVFDQAGSGTYTGQLSGTGNLVKTGANQLELTGDSSGFSGTTNIDGGELKLNGSLAGSGIVVNNGGLLSGNGAAGSVTVNSGAIIAPGNSIGTFHVDGDVQFGSGSIFQVEIDPTGQSDLLDVSGNVVINGATLNLIAPTGNYQPGATYTIINAGAAVSGEFSTIDTSLAFVTPTLEYFANRVTITIARNDVEFADVAVTRNEINVAEALKQLAANDPLNVAIIGLTAVGARQAYNALSGEAYSSVANEFQLQAQTFRSALLSRMREDFPNETPTATAFSGGGPLAISMLSSIALSAATNSVAPGSHDLQSSPNDQGIAYWSRAIGSWGELDGNANASSLDRDVAGVIAGADTSLLNRYRVGLAGGYSDADINVSARSSSLDIKSYLVGLYGYGPVGALNLRIGALWSWNEIDSSRHVFFPTLTTRQAATYDGETGQVFAEVGYPARIQSMQVEPFAGIAGIFVDTESFKENPGVAALSAQGDENSVGYATLGIRVARGVSTTRIKWTPRAAIAWQHAFGDTTSRQSMALVAGGSRFDISGVPLDTNTALVEAGIDVDAGTAAKFQLSYVGQHGSDMHDNGVQAGFSWRF